MAADNLPETTNGNPATSKFETRAEITAFIELRTLVDELNTKLVSQRRAIIDAIDGYTDEERAGMPTETKIGHRGKYLALQKIADLERYLVDTIRQCNDRIEDLYRLPVMDRPEGQGTQKTTGAGEGRLRPSIAWPRRSGELGRKNE